MKKEVRTTHVFNQADQSGNWLLAAALRQPSCCLATFNPLAYVNPYKLLFALADLTEIWHFDCQ